MPSIDSVIFIFYVADQEISTAFYRQLFQAEPALHVPGMTEFAVNPALRLGLMPEAGIARLITPVLPHPAGAAGIPRSELYLYVDAPAMFAERAQQAGAVLVSPLQARDWGDEAVYFADPDGHVLAFAKRLNTEV
jgi:lactoylglutathione lyase